MEQDPNAPGHDPTPMDHGDASADQAGGSMPGTSAQTPGQYGQYPPAPGQYAPPSGAYPPPPAYPYAPTTQPLGMPGYPPPQPFQGQGAYPPYGWPASPSVPYGYGAPPPGVPQAPPPATRHTGRILLFVGLAVVVVVASLAGLLATRGWWLTATRGQGIPAVASPTATPGASPTATSTYGPSSFHFTDPLSNDMNGWTTNSQCFFEGGTYHVLPGSAAGARWCFAPAGSFSDFDMQVTVSEVAGPLNYGYGLTFRDDAPNDTYSFVIASNGEAWCGKYVNGHFSPLTDFWQSSSIQRGLNAQNTLRVVAAGPTFRFYVNGHQVGTMTDATYARGQVGVFSGNHDLEAAFSDFSIVGVP